MSPKWPPSFPEDAHGDSSPLSPTLLPLGGEGDSVRRMLRRLSLSLVLAALSACPGPPVVTRFRIEGKVIGLEGSGLGLELNGTELLPVRIPGDFSFDTPIADGQP